MRSFPKKWTDVLGTIGVSIRGKDAQNILDALAYVNALKKEEDPKSREICRRPVRGQEVLTPNGLGIFLRTEENFDGWWIRLKIDGVEQCFDSDNVSWNQLKFKEQGKSLEVVDE